MRYDEVKLGTLSPSSSHLLPLALAENSEMKVCTYYSPPWRQSPGPAWTSFPHAPYSMEDCGAAGTARSRAGFAHNPPWMAQCGCSRLQTPPEHAAAWSLGCF